MGEYIELREISIEPRLELANFAKLMEQQLLCNDYKGGWEKCTPYELLTQAQTAMFKVHENLSQHVIGAKLDAWDTVTLCTDVANYMMMVADTARRMYDEQGIRKLPD
jgi:hypothetical protein